MPKEELLAGKLRAGRSMQRDPKTKCLLELYEQDSSDEQEQEYSAMPKEEVFEESFA